MTTRAEGATILAIDEHPEYRRRYERRLDDRHTVHTAESGAAALERLDDGIDVALVCQDLSDTTCDDILTTIRAAGYDCRVAVVSGTEPTEDLIDRGFDAQIDRPLHQEDLNDTVERLLARSSYESNLQELYRLCAQRAKARADGGQDGDQSSSEVAELEERIRELREAVDEDVSAFEATDYRASFRDLPRSK